MNRTTAISAFLVLVLCMACTNSSMKMEAQKIQKNQQSARPQVVTAEQIKKKVEELQKAQQGKGQKVSATQEVQQAAWDHWNEHFAKCGDAYYAVDYESFTPPESGRELSRSLYDPNYRPPKPQLRLRSQYACKLVEITSVRPYDVTRSDQLEGVTGKYAVKFEYACKEYSYIQQRVVQNYTGKDWMDWYNIMSFVQKGGKTIWEPPLGYTPEQEFLGKDHKDLKRADCHQIIPAS